MLINCFFHFVLKISDGGVSLNHGCMVGNGSRVDHGSVLLIESVLAKVSILDGTVFEVEDKSFNILSLASVEDVSCDDSNIVFESFSFSMSE